jgi:hypothetical protein
MTDTNRIISSRQLLVNPDGTVTQQWFRFFEALATNAQGGQFTFQDVFLAIQTDAENNSVLESKMKDAELLGWLGE